jgi:hypothetical protein
MKRILKQGIECMPAPLPVLTLESLQYFRHPRIRRDWRMRRRILGKLADPKRIAQGPFEGMGYLPLGPSRSALPMLLGTYESEISLAVEAICEARCDRIVNIGAGEGYYAVGMALRNPGARIVGFEMNPSARYYTRQLARRNGVRPRIKILGECTTTTLEAALEGAERPAVICDCEGAEDVLLDPLRVPSLRRTLILVETHEGMIAGVNRRLHDRFTPTHEVELIPSRHRTQADLPAGCALNDTEAALAMDEHRRWAEWIFMRVK